MCAHELNYEVREGSGRRGRGGAPLRRWCWRAVNHNNNDDDTYIE